MSKLSVGKFGLLTALSGVAHLAAPDAFVGITKRAFPQQPEVWVQRNGASEAVIGAAMMVPKTRKLGTIGLLAYVVWIGVNVAKVARSARVS